MSVKSFFRSLRLTANDVRIIATSRGGLELYPEAYPVLVLERSRRELQSPPQEIRLSPEAFEALPRDVQRLLMPEPG
jgi:hypothetical protein